MTITPMKLKRKEFAKNKKNVSTINTQFNKKGDLLVYIMRQFYSTVLSIQLLRSFSLI